MTRYLKIDRKEVAKALVTTLSIDSPAFYENIPRYTAIEAIKTSEGLNISSWDSYRTCKEFEYEEDIYDR